MTRGRSARLFAALDLPVEVRAQLVGWARRCASSLRACAPPDGERHERSAQRPRTPTRGRSPANAPAGHGRARGARPDAAGHLRLLEIDTLHVTLCFLGNRSVGEIDAIGQALADAVAQARPLGELSLGAPLWLPPRRPRALAVELHDDAERSLRALQEDVVRELAAVCELEPDGGQRSRQGGARHFRPHVTVARMRAGDAPRERVLPATPALSFAVERLTLYRSWLTPVAAEYEGLVSLALAA